MAFVRPRHRIPVFLAVALFALGVTVSTVFAANKSPVSTEARLLESWEAVNTLLPRNTAGNDWRAFLLMNKFRELIDQGATADPEQVRKILLRFQKDDAFLRTEPFAFARETLSEWLPMLDAAHPENAARLASEMLEEFQRPTDSEVQDATERMRAVTQEMKRFLAAHPEVRPGWENYFAWKMWQSEMYRAGLPNPDALTSVANRLQSAAEMFPDPICQKAARIIRSGTREIYRARTTPADAQLWLDKVVRLARIPAGRLKPADAKDLTAANRWLQRRDIGVRLLAAALARHSQPNFRLVVSRQILALGIDTPIHSNDPFTDVIQGVTYRGTSQTRGSVSLDLLPNPRKIALQLACELRITSSSTGTNRRATVRSGSTTNVTGKKLVTLDSAGLHLSPAQANAGTSSQIHGVQSSGFLGRRRVNNAVQDGKAATEQEVSRISEDRLENELDREAAKFLAPVTRTLKNDLRRSLILVEGFPQQMRTCSTSDFAYLVVTQAGVAQLAAPNSVPDACEPSDLMLRMHESFVSNMADSLLAGKTYSDQEFQALWKSLFGVVPEKLQNADPNNPWTITFSRKHPLQIQVDAGELVISLRAESFQVGTDTIPAMNITARYQLDTNGVGLLAARAERLDINPPDLEDGKRIGARMSILRTMLRKRFDPVFPENWKAESFKLVTRGNQKPEVKMRKVTADKGWITLAAELVRGPVVGQVDQSLNTR